MKTRPELVSVANLNYVGSYRKLVEHSANGEIREVGGVFAFATGLPISLFNGCVVVAPASAAELEAALEWVNGRGLPYRIWIDEAVAPGPATLRSHTGFSGMWRPTREWSSTPRRSHRRHRPA